MWESRLASKNKIFIIPPKSAKVARTHMYRISIKADAQVYSWLVIEAS